MDDIFQNSIINKKILKEFLMFLMKHNIYQKWVGQIGLLMELHRKKEFLSKDYFFNNFINNPYKFMATSRILSALGVNNTDICDNALEVEWEKHVKFLYKKEIQDIWEKLTKPLSRVTWVEKIYEEDKLVKIKIPITHFTPFLLSMLTDNEKMIINLKTELLPGGYVGLFY